MLQYAVAIEQKKEIFSINERFSEYKKESRNDQPLSINTGLLSFTGSLNGIDAGRLDSDSLAVSY
jgi:hypothetical protein